MEHVEGPFIKLIIACVKNTQKSIVLKKSNVKELYLEILFL